MTGCAAPQHQDQAEPAGHGFRPVGPEITVANPAQFMTYCSGCGEPFRRGGKVRRAEGGYGWLCHACSRLAAQP